MKTIVEEGKVLDKFEYKMRSEEIKTLIAKGRYSDAVNVADYIDWRRVRNVAMLCTISDLYKINRRYEESKEILLIAYDRYPEGRAIVYSLCELSIKLGEFVQAVEYYKEFVRIAPRDTGRYILQYHLYEAQDVSLEERIAVLEEFKKHDYREKWAYELAYLYHRIGLTTECIEEVDEMFLWFGEGKYVTKALELKALHEPLSPEQEARYKRYKAKQEGTSEKRNLRRKKEDESNKEVRIKEKVEEERIQEPEEEKQPTKPFYGNDQNFHPEVETAALQAGMPSREELDLQYNVHQDIMNVHSSIGADVEQIMKSDKENENIYNDEQVSDTKNDVELQEVWVRTDAPENQAEERGGMIRPTRRVGMPAVDSSGHFDDMLRQETDGQISMVVPESNLDEGQITGQISISDIMEKIKKEQKKNQEKEISNLVSKRLKGVFTQYDENVKYDLQNQMERQINEEIKRERREKLDKISVPSKRSDKTLENPRKVLFNDENDDEEILNLDDEENFRNEEVQDEKDVIEEPKEKQNEKDTSKADYKELFVKEDEEKELSKSDLSVEKDLEELEEPEKDQSLTDKNKVIAKEIEKTKDSETDLEVEEIEKSLESIEKENVVEAKEELLKPSKEPHMHFKEKSPEIKSQKINAFIPDKDHPRQPLENREKSDSDDENASAIDDLYENEPLERSSQRHLGTRTIMPVSYDPRAERAGARQEALKAKAYEELRTKEKAKARLLAEQRAAMRAARDTIVEPDEEADDQGNVDFIEDLFEVAGDNELVKGITELVNQKIQEIKEDSVEESEEPVNDGEKESEVTDSKLDLEQAITSEDLTGNKEETQEAESTTEGPDKEESDEQKKDLDVSKEVDNEEEANEDIKKESLESDSEKSQEAEIDDQTDQKEQEDIVANESELDKDKEVCETESKEIPQEDVKEEETSQVPEETSVDTEISETENEQPSNQIEDPESQKMATRVRAMTPEEKELFGPYIHHRKSRKQIIEAIDRLNLAPGTNNAIVTGEEGTGTINLAKGLIKSVQANNPKFNGKVAKITAQSLNIKSVSSIIQKLRGGALIIQRAADMKKDTVESLIKALKNDKYGIIVVLEDNSKDMNRLLKRHNILYKCFNVRVDVEALDNETLVAYAKQYAMEKEYSIDNLGVLALHSRIESMQTIDHDVTIEDVEKLVNEAIKKVSKKTVGHFFDVVFNKRYDEEDMIVLTEKDFEE